MRRTGDLRENDPFHQRSPVPQRIERAQKLQRHPGGWGEAVAGRSRAALALPELRPTLYLV